MTVFSSTGVVADPFRPAARGTQIGLLVVGLADAAITGDPAAIHVNVGGVDQVASSITSANGGALIQFNLSNSVAAGAQVPVTVSYGGATSQPVSISVR